MGIKVTYKGGKLDVKTDGNSFYDKDSYQSTALKNMMKDKGLTTFENKDRHACPHDVIRDYLNETKK